MELRSETFGRGILKISHKATLLEAYHTENGFKMFATRKMIFRDLPHRKFLFRVSSQGKWFLVAHLTENGFWELGTRKMVFMWLPNGKWFLGAGYTINLFLRLVTLKMVFRGSS